jgi:hypothetical protein
MQAQQRKSALACFREACTAGDSLRVLVPVDNGSRGLLRFVASKLLAPGSGQRQDKVAR